MPLIRPLRDPLIAAALWALLALGSLFLRDGLGAALLLWAPSGVAVAAFRSTSRSNWLRLSLVLFPAQMGAIMLGGVPLALASVYSLAALVQSVTCAALSLRVLGRGTAVPRRKWHVSGLFAVTMAGCLVGSAIVVPFRSDHSLDGVAWWFLANVLGILIVTPVILHWRGVAANWRAGRVIAFDWQLLLALLGCAFLAFVAMQERMLMPLLVAGMVGMAARFGHTAVSFTLLVYIVVASLLSLDGGSPLPYLEVPLVRATTVLQGWMLTMLATALPLAAMLLKSEELQCELIRRNSVMHENLMLLDLSEELAGIGRWRLDLVTGEQDWSPRMLEMHRLPSDLPADPGNVRHLLPDNGDFLFGELSRHRHEREPYTFDNRIHLPDGEERILRMSMLNEFDFDDQRIAVFGVAMDVTEQTRREEALDRERGKAVRLAAEAQLLANTDPLTGLPNRRCTFDRLGSMVEKAGGDGSALAALMFDIDHFKGINDSYGHQVGDNVITQVAELARRQARTGDIVGRIGGEEFVWLLPGFDPVAARALAERLRAAVERGIEGSCLPAVTISIGMACFAPGDCGDQLLARADAALYRAKRSGRNKVRRAA